MADTGVNIGNGMQQIFPFMKLPPELRLVVYELAILSHLEDIEHTRFLQCRPPAIGASLETRNRIRKARILEENELRLKSRSKASPYFGALALLHTSIIVYWESYNAMNGIIKRHISARQDSVDKAKMLMFRAQWGGQTADLQEYEADVMSTILSSTRMVHNSLSKTFRRWVEINFSVVSNGNLYGRARQLAQSPTNSDQLTRSVVETSRGATLVAAVKGFPEMCAIIQCRLEGGDGVRTSFTTGVQKSVGWKITEHDVDIMIKDIAALGATLRTIRGSNCSGGRRSFRVVKHKSRPKRHQSNTSRGLLRTWLSSDEMGRERV
jgi:hypothetical protein